ncbi:MAG: ATP-grasp domain-containing protein [Peptococcaceae bacterium]
MSLPIMILGAGYEQYPLIKRAKDRGLYVITLDKNPDAYGLSFADESHIISVKDEKVILELAGKKKITGITSLICEAPLPAIGTVSRELGLPCISRKSIEATTNKYKMREILKEKGILNPKYAQLNVNMNLNNILTAAEAIGFPQVIKPIGQGGQRGLFKAGSKAELQEALARLKSTDLEQEIIIEEFLEGEEINVVGLVLEGRIEALTISERIKDPYKSFGIVQRHLYPSNYSGKIIKAVEKLVEDIVAAIELENGMLFPQIIITEKGPLVIEMGARVPGGVMKELFEYATGYDLLDLQIDFALGEKIALEKYKKYPGFPAVTVKFLSADPGPLTPGIVLEHYGIQEALKIPGVVKADFFQDPRRKMIKPLKTGSDRFFYLVAVGQTREEVIAQSDRAAEKIHFSVIPLPGENN